MSVPTLVELQLDTIQRQAKRLASRLHLPITSAKDVLAKAFYRCSGWHDLEGRLKHAEPDDHVQFLVALPHSPEARAYFGEQSRSLATALSQHVLTNSNLAGLLDHVQAVFAIEAPAVTLNDLVPSLSLAWRPTGIGPDPWAVIEAEVWVNGTCLKLIGTRTFLPRHYDFGPEHESGEYAEPFGGMLRIVWADPAAWFRAALRYLDDLEADELELPLVELSEAMARHQAWFEGALATNSHIAEYRGGDDDLVPFLVEDSCYVVFGAPVCRTDASKAGAAAVVELASHEDNFSQLIVVGDNPLCLEWIAYDPALKRHTGEFGDYFDRLRRAIFQRDDLSVTSREDGKAGLLFVRPATLFDVQQELKVDFTRTDGEEAMVLKTSNLPLAIELILKVAIRDLMVLVRDGRSRYFAMFSSPDSEERPKLSVSLELKGAEWMSMSNLVRSSYWSKSSSGTELLVEVASELLTLVDLLGKKTVEATMSQGLIQRLPLGFQTELEKPPARCKKIPPVPDEIAAALERPFSADGYLALGRAHYLRDNF